MIPHLWFLGPALLIWIKFGGERQGIALETLDDVLRYGSMSLLLWLAVLAMRDFCGHIRGRLGAALAVCEMAYLLSSKAGVTFFGVDVDIALFLFCFMGGVIAWLFCLSQFDDHFELKPWHWAVLGIKLLAGTMLAISHFSGDGPL